MADQNTIVGVQLKDIVVGMHVHFRHEDVHFLKWQEIPNSPPSSLVCPLHQIEFRSIEIEFPGPQAITLELSERLGQPRIGLPEA